MGKPVTAEDQIMWHFKHRQATQEPAENDKATQQTLGVARPSSPFVLGNLCGVRVHLSKWLFWGCVIACFIVVAAAVGGVLGVRRAAPAQTVSSCSNSQGGSPQLTKDLPFVDEFTEINSCTWSFDIGDGTDYGLSGWGNNELQCYTNSTSNVGIIPNPDRPGDGLLRISQVYSPQAQPCVNSAGPAGSSQWTSGKIHTKGKRGFQWRPAVSGTSGCTPVVVESRIKLPYTAGRWSAFWMMPQPQWGVNVTGCSEAYSVDQKVSECGAYGPWPRSGELDIMEQVNQDNKIMGTVHYANALGYHVYSGGNVQPSSAVVQGWNVYKTVWGCDGIKWYMNGQQFNEVKRDQLGALWPFDQPFFLMLNTAVGGMLTGFAAPDQSASEMLIDYVRVSYSQ